MFTAIAGDMAGDAISARVVRSPGTTGLNRAEAGWLDAPLDCRVLRRRGELRTATGHALVARVTSLVIPPRVGDETALKELAETDSPLGAVIARLGGRREMLWQWPYCGGDTILHCCARLWLPRHDGLPGEWPCGLATEQVRDLSWWAKPGGGVGVTVLAEPCLPVRLGVSLEAGYPPLRRDIRRNLRQGAAALAADRVTARITFSPPEPVLLAELAGAYAARNALAGRVTDWCWWASACDTATEAGVLRIGGKLAAWTLAESAGPVLRVLAGQMVPGWERYRPGRLLEAVLLARAVTAGHAWVDWGYGHPGR